METESVESTYLSARIDRFIVRFVRPIATVAKVFAIAAVIVSGVTGFTPSAAAQGEDKPPEVETDGGDLTSDGHEGDQDGEVPLTAGYERVAGNGFFVRSKDDLFRLNIGIYTQARFDVNWLDAPPGEDDVESGFYLNRTRIFFEGHYTPDFNYHFRFQFDDEDEFSTVAAFLQYNAQEAWNVRAGLQFMAMTREDWQWAEDTLTTEFSAFDSAFAIGTSLGVQGNHQSRRDRFWLGLGNGTFGGKKDFPDNEASDVAITGRWEHQFLGTDWSVWDDLVGRRGRSRGILLGLAAGYQEADASGTADDGAQVTGDLSLNGDGYQVMAAISYTWHDPSTGGAFHNWGVLLQGGYFLSEHVQVYGQYNLVAPGDEPGNLETFDSITAGINYFPFLWTNRWKFSAEVGHLFSAINDTIVDPSASLGWLPSDEVGQTYFRLQAQFGF